jgi:putative SOS response-associated peptidase YedK
MASFVAGLVEAVMCSRYEIRAKKTELAERFGVLAISDDLPEGEIRPTDAAPVIRAGGICQMLNWGLTAQWNAKPVINARAETLSARPFFQPLLERRCLVPATAYFEWRHSGRHRLKNRIERFGNRPFAIAAIHDDSRFAIVTTAAIDAIAHIHDRMPLILTEADEVKWIDPAHTFPKLQSALVVAPELAFRATEDPPPIVRQGDLFG